MCFSCCGSNNTFQILIVVIRRLVVCIAVHFVSNTVITYVNKNI